MEYFALACGSLGLVYAYYTARSIMGKEEGTPKMIEISRAIADGANAYLNRQLKTIAIFAAIIAAIMWLAIGQTSAVAFVFGAALSYLAGFIGMSISVRANVRTAQAAKKGLS